MRKEMITLALVLPVLAVRGFCQQLADHHRATEVVAAVAILVVLAQALAVLAEEPLVVLAR